MQGSCHCGNISIKLNKEIDLVTSCNCSICHRYGAIWGYFQTSEVEVGNPELKTQTYQHGDKYIDFLHCATCGCVTHYTPTKKMESNKMAVNLRMMPKAILDSINIRLFDGADTWQFIET